MIKLHLLSRVVPLAALALLLVSCRAKEAAPASSTSRVISPDSESQDLTGPPKISEADQTAAKSAAAAASAVIDLQSACREKITAKMIDPTAAKIVYRPLASGDGFQADVSLQTQGPGDVLHFNYTCRRAPSGQLVTELISE